MRLSQNFTYAEMVRTVHREFLDVNAEEGYKFVDSGRALCRTILEPARAYFGNKPYVTHSGFRCLALNTAIRGSKTSQHMKFEAHDGHIVGVPLTDLFDFYRREMKEVVGQVILEGVSQGLPSWVHVSLGAPYYGKGVCVALISMDGGRTYERVPTDEDVAL